MNNRFINVVTVITIGLSILIVSAFYLFFVNAGEIMNAWKKGIRVMAYLKPDTAGMPPAEIEKQIKGLYGVQDVTFVSRKAAFAALKQQMSHQASLLEDLRENPLPDAFEIRMLPSTQSMEKIEELASRLTALDAIEDVEYGAKWLGRFSGFFDLFKFFGSALGGLFFMAAVFIVANTTRLILYSRREEVEIMRLVGATDGFIKAPFYIEGLIQGAFGGALGLIALFFTYLLVSSNVDEGFTTGMFHIRFLPAGILGMIMVGSMLVGWLGSFLSLRQFLKS